MAASCFAAVLVMLLPAAASAQSASGRARLSLNGAWDFYADIGEASLAEVKTPPATIIVPGAWQAQGFGTPGGTIPSSVVGEGNLSPADYLRHNLTARCLYVRRVAAPAEWQGQRVFLGVRRAYRYADVAVNGRRVGAYEGFSSPFEFEVTDALRFGAENEIVIGVDNRARAGRDTVGMGNYFTNTGGLGGEVFLEARPTAFIADVFAMPDLAAGQARLRVEVTGAAGAGAADWSVEAEVAPWDAAGRPTTVAGRAEQALPVNAAGDATLEVPVTLAPLRLWEQDDPFLYTATVRLRRAGAVVDERAARFGMREITRDGTGLRLNGRPLYLAGYGDDNTEPLTGMAPSDKETYLRRLRLMRGYGFNFVRHHSFFPHDEYLEAADETGMLVQAEAGMAYVKFWPGAHGLFENEWPHLIRAFRNHPSVWAWCTGNELFLDQFKSAVAPRGDVGVTVDLANPLRSGPLTTPPTVENGVFGAPGRFPAETYQQAHYYRDVEVVVDGQPHRLMPTAAPAVATVEEPRELGIKFLSERDGVVTRARYFRVAEETGAHTARLWDEAGRELASVRFENETASGWQEAAFASPVPVKAGKIHILSVNSNTAYAATKPAAQGFSREDMLAVLERAYRTAKELDPTRLVHASDGGDLQPWTDVLSHIGGSNREKPFLLHEYGNYTCTLPDFSLIPRLSGVIRPLTYERTQAFVKAHGLENDYPRYYHASLAMRAEAQKHYLEAARARGDNAGYSFWLGIDFPESPEGCWDEGVLNQLWEPKPGLTDQLPSQTGPTVLLVGAEAPVRKFYHDTPPSVDVRVSHYGARPLEKARLVWRLADGATVLSEGELPPAACAPGEVMTLGRVTLPVTVEDTPRFLSLACELRDGERLVTRNAWEFYAYPRLARPEPLPGVFSEAGALPGTAELAPGAPLPPGLRVLVTRELTRERHGDLLRAGQAAVLLLGPQGFRELKKRDRYFLNGYGGAFGGLIEPHPALDGIPHQGRLNLGLRQLIAGGHLLDAETMPAFLRDGAIVRGLGLSDWITVEKNLQRSLMLSETVSERALRLMLCTLDLTTDDPACRYVLAKLLDHLATGQLAPGASRCATADLESLLK